MKDWIFDHPRVTIPVFATIVAGITYAVFDPIRVFFITSKVTQRFNPEEYAIYRWLRNETWAHFMPSSSKNHLNASGYSVWADDAEKTDKLISYLAETPGKIAIYEMTSSSSKLTIDSFRNLCSRYGSSGQWKIFHGQVCSQRQKVSTLLFERL